MKRFLIAVIPFLVSAVAHGAEAPQLDASASSQAIVVPDTPPPTLDALMRPESKATSKVTDLRRQMLLEAGRTVGFRGGMAARAYELIGVLKGRASSLDTMYQFAPLISKNGTLPPVIVEARDLSAFAPDQIRTANRVYKIEREERFVSVPPTWRDYLFVGLPVNSSVDLPAFAARPQDSDEEKIWQKVVKEGWDDGYKQADAILAANFNRLTRDYTGIQLYSTLLQSNMISSTRIAESQQTVTGDGKQLMLGDKLRRVTERAKFETDPNKWRPTVNKGQAPRKVAAPTAPPAPVQSIPVATPAPSPSPITPEPASKP